MEQVVKGRVQLHSPLESYNGTELVQNGRQCLWGSERTHKGRGYVVTSQIWLHKRRGTDQKRGSTNEGGKKRTEVGQKLIGGERDAKKPK